MNCKKQNGFALIVVIMTLSLMGAMLVVLGNMSRTFVFETNTAYLEACSRNLSASGLAWAKYHVKNQRGFTDGRIPLDVNDMKIPHATLHLDIVPPATGKKQVSISTSVSRGRQHIHKKSIFNLP